MASLARGQLSLAPEGFRYPLWPPLVQGCPRSGTAGIAYPLEVDYDYGAVPRGLFTQPPLPGLGRWAPLLPPLATGLEMGEGGTPLIAAGAVAARWTGWDGPLYLKDESQNPTRSHKDRLNLCAVSAAAAVGARGVVVASSGNHGGSAAAYAARAGLPCIVVVSAGTPPGIQEWVASYGAAVLQVEPEQRWPVMGQIVEHLGFHPVSNLTENGHTGHPFGPEGYKTIAYEIFLQLGHRPPAAVFVPTGYGELLYGVWKGFAELRRLGQIGEVPRLFACEPAARAPLYRALATGRPVARVPAAPTAARAIATTVSGYRGVVAVRQSGGKAIAVDDETLAAAWRVLARSGLAVELSSAAGLAGLRLALTRGERFAGPVVCLTTAAGFKGRGDETGDGGPGASSAPLVSGDWPAVRQILRSRFGIGE